MKIIEKITNEETPVKERLKTLTGMIKDIRSTYGNEESIITAVKVNSVNGMVAIGLLTKEEKLAVGEQALRSCISRATAVTENTEGALFDRTFEAFVACDPLLSNLTEKSDSQY